MTAIKTWRVPSDEQIAEGVAKLAAIIGPVEAAKPSWTRRLVLAEPSGEWCLLIDCCGEPSSKSLAPWAEPEVQLRTWPAAFPLSEAMAILQGPDDRNPEKILASRRARVAEHEAEENRAKAKAQAEADRREADKRQLAADKERFNFDGWANLESWQQGFYGLAVLVRDRDPDLAANLRTIASEGRGFKPARPGFPRCDWERGT